jgi:hypothetical protein
MAGSLEKRTSGSARGAVAPQNDRNLGLGSGLENVAFANDISGMSPEGLEPSGPRLKSSNQQQIKMVACPQFEPAARHRSTAGTGRPKPGVWGGHLAGRFGHR